MNYSLKQMMASLVLLALGLALAGLAREAWNAPCLTATAAGGLTVYRGQEECAALLVRLVDSSKRSGMSLGIEEGLRQKIDKNRGMAFLYGLGAGLSGLLVVGIFVWTRTRSGESSPANAKPDQ